MIGVQEWRLAIGAFCGGTRHRMRSGGKAPDGIYMRFGLLLLVLLVVGGVEKNPGPVEVSALDLATYLADRVTSIKIVDRVGLGKKSLFFEASTHFAKKIDACLAATLFMRWKRNTGQVREIFQKLVSCKNQVSVPVAKNKRTRGLAAEISYETLTRAVCKVTNTEVPDQTVNIFESPIWACICKELKCKDTLKNKLKARNVWRTYCSKIDHGNEECVKVSSERTEDAIDENQLDIQHGPKLEMNKLHLETEPFDNDNITEDDNIHSVLRIAECIVNSSGLSQLSIDDQSPDVSCSKLSGDSKVPLVSTSFTAYIYEVKQETTFVAPSFDSSTVTSEPGPVAEVCDSKKKGSVPKSVACDGEGDITKRKTFSELSRKSTLGGRFRISLCDWNLIEKTPNVYDWIALRHVLRKSASAVIGFCLVIFVTHRVNRQCNKSGTEDSPILVYYGRCAFMSCKQFVFKFWKRDDVFVDVFSSGDFRHEGPPKSSRLQGLDRFLVQKDLVKTKPKSFLMDRILESDPKKVQAGNLGDIKSLEVFQKARSEGAKRGDKATDDFIDIYLKFQEESKTVDKSDQFIQFVGYPLVVCVFSYLQMQMLQFVLPKRSKCVLHIDSTGSVVRPLKDAFKTVYYYSGVVHVQGKLVSVMDFVSVQHDVGCISSFFNRYISFQNRLTKRKFFSHIVIDFSQALLQSVLISWNRMSVLAYLKRMFIVVNRKDFSIKKIVTVHLCCNHFMHMVSGDLSKFNITKSIHRYVMHAIAVLIDCSSYDEFLCKVKDVLLIFHSPSLSTSVRKAVTTMDSTIKTVNIQDEIDENQSVLPDSFPTYKSSPFYEKGKMIEAQVLQIIGQESCELTNVNPFQCQTFVSLFLTRYMPYCPLWSGFLIKHSKTDSIGVSRLSNAQVEGWFNQVKDSVLDRQTNLKVGRFVDLLTKRIKSQCKEIMLAIPKSSCNKPRKTQKRKQQDTSQVKPLDQEPVLNDNDPSVEEKWLRKFKKPKTYFQTKLFDIVPKDVQTMITDITTDPVSVYQPTPTPQLKSSESVNCRYQTGTDLAGVTSTNPVSTQVSKKKQYGPSQVELSTADYNSLDGHEWLTDLAIDAVMETIIENAGKVKECLYAAASIGHLIVGRHDWYSGCYLTSRSVSAAKYMFIPFNVAQNHWCLVVADVVNKGIYCFDSLSGHLKDSNSILENILGFFCQLNALEGQREDSQYINVTGWSDFTHTISYPLQKDSHNCGVFVIYYMDSIMKHDIAPGKTIDDVDIDLYRTNCKLLLNNEPVQSNAQVPFFPNGLIPNPKYYCTPLGKKSELVVGHIKNKQMGRFLEKLYQVHYVSLFGNNWFNDCIVDFCNATYVQLNQFCFAVGESTLMLRDEHKLTVVSKPVVTIMKNLRLIFIPYNPVGANHFTLYVLDLQRKLISHLDPLNGSSSHNVNMCQKIIRFFHKRNVVAREDKIDIDSFEIVNINYPLQSDSFNCGPFVVFYLSNLSKKNQLVDIVEDMNPHEFRSQLQMRCLKLSLDITALCLLCGGRERKKHNWCQCSLCRRWIHYPCLETDIPWDEITSSTYEFFCPLCKMWGIDNPF